MTMYKVTANENRTNEYEALRDAFGYDHVSPVCFAYHSYVSHYEIYIPNNAKITTFLLVSDIDFTFEEVL